MSPILMSEELLLAEEAFLGLLIPGKYSLLGAPMAHDDDGPKCIMSLTHIPLVIHPLFVPLPHTAS